MSEQFSDYFLCDGAILRLLDANANRAREALRVLEDYARFILDDSGLCRQLKALRHGLADATRVILPDALLHRDTPGDVGTSNKTDAELTRSGLGDVVTAAGKRLGEALRAIEEYLKTIDPAASAAVEALRYQGYELERQLLWTLRPANLFPEVRIYVLITESVCKLPWKQAAEAVLIGGADCIQLREKSLESGELLRRAKWLTGLCREFGVPCIINDRPDIAVLAGADGVHVGQGDLPAADVRRIVGHRKIVGVSTHEIRHAKQAVLDGADYIGVGPFFKSTTKPRDFVAGPAYAKEVAEQIKIPAVAIAGITAENVGEVLATGIKAVALSAAVLAKDDPAGAVREIRAQMGVPNVTRPRAVGRTFLSVTPQPNNLSSETAPDSFAEQAYRRKLPHWRLQGATYFITFRLARGEMERGDRFEVLQHIRQGDGAFYLLIGMVVMPDHVHVILKPKEPYTLERITKGTKGVTANLLNRRWQRRGQVWQDESWDRILRDQEELEEKLLYMLNNPVKKGLSKTGWEYDGWYYNSKR